MKTADGFGRAIAAAVLVSLVAAALVGGPVGAHGGNAVFDVETDVSGDEVTLDVRITYDTDGEPAEGALVEAFGVGPSDEQAGPVTLERVADGRYVGSTTVPVAGTWRFTIVSSFPPGSTEVALDVDESGGGWIRGVARWILLLLVAGAFAAAAVAVARRRRPQS